jgi:simple sugar transport system permease protein
MTTAIDSDIPTTTYAPLAALKRNSAARLAVYAALGFLAFSLTTAISGEYGMSSSNVMGGMIALGVPIMLAGLGGLWSERAGVVNIGLEAQMILGTWFAAEFAWKSGSYWMLIVGGIVGGILGGVLHAIATVYFGVDQIISGVALNILAPGIAKYLAGIVFTTPAALATGGGPTQSPKVNSFPVLNWQSDGNWLDKVHNHHWFLISDLAGLLGGLVTSLTVFTILMLLLIPLTWFVLWRTSFGLRLRSVGESPSSAESLGVKVYTMKATGVLISGSLAGLGGAFLVDYTGIYHEGQTGGRGFIGLAAMIFGNWRPGGLLAGSALFGYTDSLQQQTSAKTVHALLLLAAILLLGVGAWVWYQGRRTQAIVSLALGVAVLIWYVTTNSIPPEFATYTPQIITLVVLAVASQRLRPPAADGVPWRRGQGH